MQYPTRLWQLCRWHNMYSVSPHFAKKLGFNICDPPPVGSVYASNVNTRQMASCSV